MNSQYFNVPKIKLSFPEIVFSSETTSAQLCPVSIRFCHQSAFQLFVICLLILRRLSGLTVSSLHSEDFLVFEEKLYDPQLLYDQQ